METLFWASVGVIAYVYVGYPIVLGLWAAAVKRLADARPHRRAKADRPLFELPETPGVTVIIAVRNEAARLPARIQNILASDYPADRLDIVVASDGSTDGIAAAVAPFGERVTLLMLPPGGKAAALNAAVREANRPVLVFADARQRFAPDAIRHLVRHFQDPSIGAVSGELIIESDSGSTVGDGIGAYWSYEKWLRRREGVVGSTLGVTGAIYAMRRVLWRPLPPDTLLDDVLGPMRVVVRGYRVIFESGALAFDRVSANSSAELRRKVRTLAGNFQLLGQEPRLLLPILNPVWLQFMSHKVGRLFVPYALVGAFVTSAALAPGSWFYAAACGAQAAFYGLAAYGAVLERRRRAAGSPLTEVIRDAA